MVSNEFAKFASERTSGFESPSLRYLCPGGGIGRHGCLRSNFFAGSSPVPGKIFDT